MRVPDQPAGRTIRRTTALALVEPDPRWPATFARERELLRAALGADADDVQQIGSTAVPGLPAKPIVDITVIVDPLQPPAHYVERMERAGYIFGISGEDHQRQIYWKKEPDAVNVHIVQRGSVANLRHLLFRDWLRAHPEDVAAYAALKRRNAERFAFDVQRYVDAKTDFIEAIVERAATERGIAYRRESDS